MKYPGRNIVNELREEFPKGCQVELIKMDDPQAPCLGMEGTVIGVDDVGSIMIEWDDGSSLSAVYGEDIVRKVGG